VPAPHYYIHPCAGGCIAMLGECRQCCMRRVRGGAASKTAETVPWLYDAGGYPQVVEPCGDRRKGQVGSSVHMNLARPQRGVCCQAPVTDVIRLASAVRAQTPEWYRFDPQTDSARRHGSVSCQVRVRMAAAAAEHIGYGIHSALVSHTEVTQVQALSGNRSTTSTCTCRVGDAMER
jgi:hypothetical protein